MREHLTEKRIDSRTIYEGPIFHVEKHNVILPNGNTANRDVVVNPNATAIVAIDDD